MSYGTYVTVEHYYNHIIVGSKVELQQQLSEARADLAKAKGTILALCVATPKDICPSDQDPIIYINESFERLWEEIQDIEYRINALVDIADGWDTKEEG